MTDVLHKPRIDTDIKLYKDAGVLTDAYERDRQWKYRADPARSKHIVNRTMIFNYNRHGDVAVEGGAGADCDRSNNEINNGFMGK